MKATKKVAPKKIIKKTTVPKMQDGGATYGPPRNSCGEKNKRKMKNLNNREKAGRILGGVGKVAAGTAAVVVAGAVAYKKSTPFKNAVDELKGKLGFNKKGGAVKKYAKGGSTKKDCPDGYTWDGTNCVEAGPFHSLGAKLGVGAGAAGFLGIATSMTINKIKDMKEKKKAKKALKELESKGTVAPRSLIKKQ